MATALMVPWFMLSGVPLFASWCNAERSALSGAACERGLGSFSTGSWVKKHANLNLMLFQGSPNSDGSLPDPVPKPSALRVAILRASHRLLDTPLIFDDPLALQILGAGEEALLRSDPSRYDTFR